MIVIAGQFQLKPGMRDEAIRQMIVMHDASSAEDGCVSYRFYADLAVPETVFLFEEWESEAALAAHGQTAHMAEWRRHTPNLFAGRSLKRYEVTSAGPL